MRVHPIKAAFASDVKMPDGSTVMAGQRFKKVWRIQNTGDVPWTGKLNFLSAH